MPLRCMQRYITGSTSVKFNQSLRCATDAINDGNLSPYLPGRAPCHDLVALDKRQRPSSYAGVEQKTRLYKLEAFRSKICSCTKEKGPLSTR